MTRLVRRCGARDVANIVQCTLPEGHVGNHRDGSIEWGDTRTTWDWPKIGWWAVLSLFSALVWVGVVLLILKALGAL